MLLLVITLLVCCIINFPPPLFTNCLIFLLGSQFCVAVHYCTIAYNIVHYFTSLYYRVHCSLLYISVHHCTILFLCPVSLVFFTWLVFGTTCYSLLQIVNGLYYIMMNHSKLFIGYYSVLVSSHPQHNL